MAGELDYTMQKDMRAQYEDLAKVLVNGEYRYLGIRGMEELAKNLMREHPTRRQELLGNLFTLLMKMDETYIPDARDSQSFKFLADLRKWIREEQKTAYDITHNAVRFRMI